MVHRIAALEMDSCNSKKCGLECIKFCPVNKEDSDCIVLGDNGKAIISESLCTGCGICIQKCPFDAITILNLGEELLEKRMHQYGINTFRLYNLPTLRRGNVIGLVGRNGVGKSTALNILSGNLKPNFGDYSSPPDWDEIIDYFKGTEYKDHFSKISSNTLQVSVKPQAVYSLSNVWKGDTLSLLKHYDERNVIDTMIQELDLEQTLNRKVSELSGGELQRVAVAVSASREADLYLFDEPSSYNDIYQRLNVSNVIQKLASDDRSVIIVEHDLTLLDYLCDFVQILYGDQGAYGIVSSVQSSRKGINTLLDGYLPTENVRFRDTPISFAVYAPIGDESTSIELLNYSNITKSYPGFTLSTESGSIRKGEVIGILGANALGKTTFLKILAGVEKPDTGQISKNSSISYKPQYLSSNNEKYVEDLFYEIQEGIMTDEYRSNIFEPMRIQKLYPRKISELSGGELQKVAVAVCLSQDAEIYVMDEPSAFLDIEDRMSLAKAIQQYVRLVSKSALIIDHDIQLVDIVSDSLIIFEGSPGIQGFTTQVLTKEEGMNNFLKQLDVTYRRDLESGRPRVNKHDSKSDRLQKESNSYYYLSTVPD